LRLVASKAFQHVIRRGGQLQYNRRIPAAVKARPSEHQRLFNGRTHFRQSLGASEYRAALRAAEKIHDEFERLVAEALTPAALALPTATRRFSAEALADVSAFIRERMILHWRQMILRAEINEDDAHYLDVQLDKVIYRPHGTDEMTQLLGCTPVERARQINASWGFNLSEDSDEFAELVLAVKDGCVSGRKGVQDIFAGKALPDEPTSALINRFGAAKKKKTRLFSELVSDHRKRDGFAASTRVKMKRAHDFFLKVVGDKPIAEITRDDVVAFLDALSRQQVGAASGRPKPITRETIQSYLTQISSPLSWAIERGWMSEANPAKGFKVGNWAAPSDQKERRRRFSVIELNELFRHPWFSGCESEAYSYRPGHHVLEDMRYWAPVVALYTGGRAAELAGLKLSEVKLADAYPHILIQANEHRYIKSGERRHIPVLDALLNLGFAAYVERLQRQGAERLFPDWEKPNSGKWASAKWIKAFNRTLLPSVFAEAAAEDHKSPLVFHSLRGSFKVLMLNGGPRHLANGVIGHVQDDLDKAYVGQLTPAETHEAFHHLDYAGLKIPSRSPPSIK
jgi:integrase